LFSVFGDEVPALCHLLGEKRDGHHVPFDCLQGLGIVNERKDVAHRACQANDVLVAVFLVYEHLRRTLSDQR